MKYGTVTLADPRYFDGDPYEVGGRAVLQARGIAGILKEYLDDVLVFARNAELERHDEPSLEEWLASPQARQYAVLLELLDEAESKLAVLQKAAEYNPKHR